MKSKFLQIFSLILLLIFPPAISTLQAQSISRAKLIAMTPKWEGERFPDGRPKVSDDILERMARVTIEEAWGTLRRHDYYNQFEGGWKILHPGEPIIGRALTAAYFPARPDVEQYIIRDGKEAGFSGPPNT